MAIRIITVILISFVPMTVYTFRKPFVAYGYDMLAPFLELAANHPKISENIKWIAFYRDNIVMPKTNMSP